VLSALPLNNLIMVALRTLSVFLALSIAVPASADSVVWTVNCAPLTVQRSDPILFPGVPGSHVHAVVGGTAFNRTMTGINAAVNALVDFPLEVRSSSELTASHRRTQRATSTPTTATTGSRPPTI
jgi:hypothetical protein